MTRRLREGDCLSELRKDLERQAATVRPWEADEWLGWIRACAELLAAVPDELQRIAWAWSLGQPVLRSIVGVSQELLMGTLVSTAEMIRRAKTSCSTREE